MDLKISEPVLVMVLQEEYYLFAGAPYHPPGSWDGFNVDGCIVEQLVLQLV